MHSSGRHILNWISILIAIPVGMLGAMAALVFHSLIEMTTRLIFNSGDEFTYTVMARPWYCWPLIVGVGGLLAGFLLH